MCTLAHYLPLLLVAATHALPPATHTHTHVYPDCYDCIDRCIVVGGKANFCPVCNVLLGPNPWEHNKLKYDFMLDSIVRKVRQMCWHACFTWHPGAWSHHRHSGRQAGRHREAGRVHGGTRPCQTLNRQNLQEPRTSCAPLARIPEAGVVLAVRVCMAIHGHVLNPSSCTLHVKMRQLAASFTHPNVFNNPAGVSQAQA